MPDRLSLLKLLSAATCLAVLGCGKQGAPLPPLRMTPAVPMDLRLAQRGPRLELSARAPRASVDGLRLPVLDMEFAWTVRSAQGVGAEQRRVTRAAPGEVVLAVIDPAPAPGTTVDATVRARVERRVSRPAPVIRLEARLAPEAPQDLSVERVRSGVSLSWSTPTVVAVAPKEGVPMPSPAETAARFWIYRRTETGAFGPPINPEPTEKTALLDTSAEAEDAVCYAVRRVAVADPVVESDATAEHCVPAGERRAPLPPRNLAITTGAGAANVSWTPPADERAVGYRVYRMRANGIPERIAELGAAAQSYRDTGLKPGAQPEYAVTALDRDGRESVPAKATVTQPREP